MTSFQSILEWVNSNSGAVTAIATTIYVITTFAICFFNFKSTRAGTKQVALMQSEHEEQLRLSVMPWFEMQILPISEVIKGQIRDLRFLCDSKSETHTFFAEIQIRNIGNCSAFNLMYRCQRFDTQTTIEGTYFSSLIPRGDSYPCTVAFEEIVDGEFISTDIWSFTLKFQDIFGNEYSQKYTWEMESRFADARKMPIAKCHSKPPVYISEPKH